MSELVKIVCASGKGGTGKSTLATLLSVCASKTGKTLLYDAAADQGSSTNWFHRRQGTKAKSTNLQLAKSSGSLRKDLQLLGRKDLGIDVVVLDAPPTKMDTNDLLVREASLVVIVTRPVPFDVEGLVSVIDLCRRHNRPFVFLINAADPRSKPTTDQAVKALSKYGPVLKARLSQRAAYANSVGLGLVGHEVDSSLKTEVDTIWKELLSYV